jgi:hypothetical protein
MGWEAELKADVLPWLLEKDWPGMRYLALRDLRGCSDEDRELKLARRAAHQHGPIAAVLSNMNDEGYWVTPGAGYNPKYRSTVWSIILLAQLGARASDDKRIQNACDYLLDHALADGGQFTTNGAASGTADCLQGNLVWALLELQYEDARLETALDWMARSVTGEGIAPMTEREAPVRYYAGKCGPVFACGANNKQPCAWGGVKVMMALGKWPKARRTAAIKRAIQQGVDFLFSVDPSDATYPSGWAAKPSGNWWKFGFPIFYVTDLLQVLEALCGLGYARDPRLSRALELVRQKQDDFGRWSLDYDYAGKTWVDFGPKRQPNKWVTLRALRVLKTVA